MKISTSIGAMLLAGATASLAQAQTKSEDFINPPPPRTSATPDNRGFDNQGAEGRSSNELSQPGGRGASELVYRNGPWFVVRSVRDGGKSVTCSGKYRVNRNIHLNKDSLVIQTPVHVSTVSVGFDDQAMGAARALAPAEREVGAVALRGDTFEQLSKRGRLKIDVVTNDGAKTRQDLDLHGLAGAVKYIEAGCPARR